MIMFALTVWSYIKKYWQIIVLIIGIIISLIFFRDQESDLAKRLKEIKDAHDEELKKINEAREEERRQYQENEKKFKSTIEAIQSQYDAAKKGLDDKKKAEIIKIVQQYGTDPVELAKQLSNATGFEVILPENE